MAGPTITISPGNADEVVLGPGDIEAVDAVKIHTGVSDFRADVSYDPSLKDLRGSEVHIDDPAASYFFRGFLLRTNSREAAGTADTAIEGLGIEHDLERNASEHTVTNTLIHDAIADYWSNNTGFSATVTDQTADNTTTGTQAQEANTDAEFTAIVELDDTDPLAVQNNNLELLQSCWFTEAEDGRNPGNTNGGRGTTSGEADDFSGADGYVLENTGEWTEYTFTVDYDVPEGDDNFLVWVRAKRSGTTDQPAIDVTLDGELLSTDSSWGTSADWSQQAPTNVGGVSAGEHTIRLEAASIGTDSFLVDFVAPLDGRFTYNTTSNTLNGDNALPGPELYPDQFEKELTVAPTTWNVTDATLSTTWNNTTNNQRIQMQLYPNGTWSGATNSTSTTEDFGTDAGTAIKGRARFSRFTSDSTTTPHDGDTGQNLQSWEITFDGNDIPVYTDTTLEGDDMAILQQMSEDARMRFTATHSANSKTVESYPTGETKSTPDWDVIGKNFMADLGAEFANHITVRGARDSDGNRIKQTISDNTSISNFGQEHWEEPRPDASTQVEVDRIARQVLKSHLRESDVTAEREIPSQEVDVGYGYLLQFQDGSSAEVPSEEVHYRYRAGDVTGRVVFDVRATRLEERLNSVDSGLIRTQLSF